MGVAGTHDLGGKLEELRLGSRGISEEQNIDVSSSEGAIWHFLETNRIQHN